MASMGRLCVNVCRTVVPRRTFTTGKSLRATPPGKPNDSMPFMYGHEKTLNKTKFTVGYVFFVMTGMMWPIMAIRDQCIRIGSSIED